MVTVWATLPVVGENENTATLAELCTAREVTFPTWSYP
jgi:hypothetical protein